MPKKTEEQVITTKEKETILPASPEKLAPTSILTISADADIETPESKIPTGMSCKTPTGPKKSSPAHSAVSKNWSAMEQ